jgi:hypothetical protein
MKINVVTKIQIKKITMISERTAGINQPFFLCLNLLPAPRPSLGPDPI